MDLLLQDRPSSNLAATVVMANPIHCASVRFPPTSCFRNLYLLVSVRLSPDYCAHNRLIRCGQRTRPLPVA